MLNDINEVGDLPTRNGRFNLREMSAPFRSLLGGYDIEVDVLLCYPLGKKDKLHLRDFLAKKYEKGLPALKSWELKCI